MKTKQLQSYLKTPNISLEQYTTTVGLASDILTHIRDQYDDIENKTILELGIGSVSEVQFVDPYIDSGILNICKQNIEVINKNIDLNIDLINADILNLNCIRDNSFDIVIMNPPFGTKNNEGIDTIFLEKAIKIAKIAVYSLHKTSTRNFFVKRSQKMNCKIEIVAELKFELKNTYKFHKLKNKNIRVDLIKFYK